MMKKGSLSIFLILFFLGGSFPSFAAKSDKDHGQKEEHHEHAEHAHDDAGHGEGETDPIAAIMHHISDANEFHILTLGEKHISLPLPVIVYNKDHKKLDMFMSSKLAHGHEHKGYHMYHGRVAATDHSKIIDFSITKNVFTMLLALLIMLIVFSRVAKAYKDREGKAPKGLQSFIEPIFQYIREDVLEPNLGHKADKYLPYIMSIFFFVLTCNLMGLVPFFPGSANISGNIAFTMTLAVFTFIITQISGNKDYWTHVLAMPGVPKWVLVILTPIEILGLFTKPFALMMRLFANITAGHIIILSLVSLIFILGDMGKSVGGTIGGIGIAFPFVLFMNAIELFVAFLQAYIFALLSAIFIGAAIEEHHH